MAMQVINGPRVKVLGPPLKRLIAACGRFRARIPQEQLVRLVSRLDVSIPDVADFCLFDDHHYVRNTVHRAAHFEVLCLCWQSGQRSPIHDHDQSNCVVRVLQGVMTNIDFRLLPSGYILPAGASQHGIGVTDARSEADIHQVANLQPPGSDLVTLHVYSPPLTRMHVFSPDRPYSSRPYFPTEHGLCGDGI
jgi:cysteine dioxygenase